MNIGIPQKIVEPFCFLTAGGQVDKILALGVTVTGSNPPLVVVSSIRQSSEGCGPLLEILCLCGIINGKTYLLRDTHLCLSAAQMVLELGMNKCNQNVTATIPFGLPLDGFFDIQTQNVSKN